MDERTDKERENRRRWDGRPGFYEVWYLKWNDLATRTAGWVRYTLTAPKAGAPMTAPVGELWGMFFDAADPRLNFAGKQTWPAPMVTGSAVTAPAATAAATAPAEENFFVLPGGAIGRRASGRVADTTGREFSWDLSFNSAGPAFRHLPYDFLYRGGFPKTKPVSPHQDARVSGEVRLDGRTITLHDAPGQQTHIWGAQHAHCWVWGHGNVFKEGEAVWEGLDSRVRVGPWRSPSLSLFYLRRDGREYRFNSIGSLLKNRSRWSIGSWEWLARSGEWELNGKAAAAPGNIITVTYTDPDGSHLWCRNSKVGSLTLELRERGKKRLTLSADETAAVEFVDRELGPGERVWI